jgi:hypothetical protein
MIAAQLGPDPDRENCCTPSSRFSITAFCRLTGGNHAELLAAADHKSKRQVELLVAALRPQPDVAAKVRRLPRASIVPRAATPAAATPVSLAESGPEVPAPAPARLERYKIQFTASAATHAKLRLAQKLLRHQIPNGVPAAIIDRALSLLVAELDLRCRDWVRTQFGRPRL